MLKLRIGTRVRGLNLKQTNYIRIFFVILRHFLKRAWPALIRFQTKGAVLLRFQKNICLHIYRIRFENALIPSVRMQKLTQGMRISDIGPRNWREIEAHGRICPPFCIVKVEWPGAWSCLFWWPHRFQIASFSPPTLENIVLKSLHTSRSKLPKCISKLPKCISKLPKCIHNSI